ncbi:iron-containing redox enzyme family protein [Actinospica sp. MGRD01-02]|uniref:Iron-containing redox enzyme family protein n=1 Tax=Actinospica acidithermotolerans TaxID=2828514 RepID=A0A941EKI9_9ACTN|nr:iron-containing redox enzyme family protein [Actinospica acidithermotolerans]MBR7829279.1 iron-containing redox enzyme family protein [Actinospica acidithermotolerans]
MGITDTRTPLLPPPRGPVSAVVVDRLTSPPDGTPISPRLADAGDPRGEDHQLALYICYELHYRGFEGVAPRWEWDPSLLALRARLEHCFLAAVREELGQVPALEDQLEELLVEPPTGSGPSHYLLEKGERWQAREYLAQRSLYHLKEADPQAWVIPRLHGRAQAAYLAIEYDEYGGGNPQRTHSLLFATMMRDMGLDATYGAYVAAAPAEALAAVNLMSLFGLHREHRGALIGQFAAVEITSSPGARRLAEALTRLGASADGTDFYREHVEADAVHEQLVRREVIGALLEDEPHLEEDIAFGLAASVRADDKLGEHAVECWRQHHSSLRIPLTDSPGALVAAR